jgi:hypothetical protein
MMLWLVLGIEALVIVAIFVQMMRKRSSLQADDDDADQTTETAKPGMSLELPHEEKWE